jgi:hypothetical protein
MFSISLAYRVKASPKINPNYLKLKGKFFGDGIKMDSRCVSLQMFQVSLTAEEAILL